MKRLCLALVAATLASAPALSADMAVRPPPPPISAPIFTWTGFYLGGNIGAGWTSTVIRESFFGAEWSRSSDARFIGGGQIGYNWQFNQFVLGIEGDIDAIANRSRSTVVTLPVLGTFAASSSSDANWVSTIAARFGFAVDRALFYGKAGYGWVGGTGSATITNVATGATLSVGGDGNRGGWLVGGGIEYAIAHNWTLKGEYNYLATGRDRTFVVPVGAPFLVGDTFTSTGRNVSMVKFGFNYLFH
jgi:outer membrane immunogenic protein